MPGKDRTAEFFDKVNAERERRLGGHSPHAAAGRLVPARPRSARSKFAADAAAIMRQFKETTIKLEKLTKCAWTESSEGGTTGSVCS